jgi:hypothetical protein
MVLFYHSLLAFTNSIKMQNQEFYVKYKENQAVPIDTAYGRGPQGTLPLVTVAHLVAAVKQALPSKLGAIDPDELTLHLPNGVLRNALEEGCFADTDSTSTTLRTGLALSRLANIGLDDSRPLVIKVKNHAETISEFLSQSLDDLKIDLPKPSSTGTERSYPKSPRTVERWECFLSDAAKFNYPTTPIPSDVSLPQTSELTIKLEKDVDTIIHTHLLNFNRIFRSQKKSCRFESKAGSFSATADSTTASKNLPKFIGAPDFVLTLDDKVLTFIEDKTPNDLPVPSHDDRDPFDLLDLYMQDLSYKTSNTTRGNIGRKDVCTVINQVYGYLSLNNLIYGCVTCYGVTYFLWRPARGTLRISHHVWNSSRSPTLLQALYYFVDLVLQGHNYKQQELDPSPVRSDKSTSVSTDLSNSTSSSNSESGSNYSSDNNDTNNGKRKRSSYGLNIDSLRSGTFVGVGATGQVIRLRDSNVVVKHCDSYNNPDGFKMLQNEISIYEKLSKLNLPYIPRYYGECEFYGQYFIALDFIPGSHCDWRTSSDLSEKLKLIIRDLKSAGVVHLDLRPENVLLTPNGEIKLIDFGKAEMSLPITDRLKG